jgi:hypothetical protein
MPLLIEKLKDAACDVGAAEVCRYERLLIGRDPIVGNIALRGAQVEFATANFRAQ